MLPKSNDSYKKFGNVQNTYVPSQVHANTKPAVQINQPQQQFTERGSKFEHQNTFLGKRKSTKF